MCEIHHFGFKMVAVKEVLLYSAENAYKDLSEAIEGVNERQSWSRLPNLGSDYLHTDATIYGIVMHIATAKKVYAGIAWHGGEPRWSKVAEELDAFEPDWEKAKAFWREAQEYWLSSWKDLSEDQLRAEVQTNYKKSWIAWQFIDMMIRHDAYHAGQINILRYGVAESDTKPELYAEDIRKYCAESDYF